MTAAMDPLPDWLLAWVDSAAGSGGGGGGADGYQCGWGRAEREQQEQVHASAIVCLPACPLSVCVRRCTRLAARKVWLPWKLEEVKVGKCHEEEEEEAPPPPP